MRCAAGGLGGEARRATGYGVEEMKAFWSSVAVAIAIAVVAAIVLNLVDVSSADVFQAKSSVRL